MEPLNIYQMYIENGCRFGFYVTRHSWRAGRYAKVTGIEWVTEGKMIKGEPPYFGGFKNPPGHPRAGKTMGPRIVTLEAEWLRNGKEDIKTGGTYAWTQVYPENPAF